MSQNDFNIANQGFPSFRSDLNDALQALASNSSGATEPSTTYAGQFWYDSTNDVLKFRNEANSAWIDPPIAGLVTALSDLGVTASAAELNKLDGVLTTTAELNYVDGVTSNIQTQLGGKVDTSGDSMTGNLNFGDNDKAVFGTGSDLQIYHDGSHSYVSDQGTGNIKYRAASRHQFENADGSKMYIQLVGDTVGQEHVELRYNNAEKLATTSSGVSVTGTVAATSYTGNGSALTGVGTSTAAGAVGTYTWGRPLGYTAYDIGDTASGIYPLSLKDNANFQGTFEASGWLFTPSAPMVGAIRSGTWRAMMKVTNDGDIGLPALWVRIS